MNANRSYLAVVNSYERSVDTRGPMCNLFNGKDLPIAPFGRILGECSELF